MWRVQIVPQLKNANVLKVMFVWRSGVFVNAIGNELLFPTVFYPFLSYPVRRFGSGSHIVNNLRAVEEVAWITKRNQYRS